MVANVSHPCHPEKEISRLFSPICQPARIQILLVIASREGCACHMEAVTGMRRARILQHLMVLRKAGLVTPNRAGRNIFSQLAGPEVITLLHQTAQLAGIGPDSLLSLAARPTRGCPRPQCSPDMDPKLTCKGLEK